MNSSSWLVSIGIGIAWVRSSSPHTSASIQPVIQSDTATISLHSGLAGLRCGGREASEDLGKVYRRTQRRARPVPAQLDRRHLVAWRFDRRQRRPNVTIGREFMIPHGLHIGAEPIELVCRLVSDAADEGLAGL